MFNASVRLSVCLCVCVSVCLSVCLSEGGPRSGRADRHINTVRTSLGIEMHKYF